MGAFISHCYIVIMQFYYAHTSRLLMAEYQRLQESVAFAAPIPLC
jgi:hypothetical protein